MRRHILSRRRVLRGLLNGVAVTVAVPFLNCFLDENGTALAGGAPMPVRFGTWFWGLGMNRSIFVPKTVGADYDLPEEIKVLAPVRQHINVFSDFNVFRDSNPNACHFTGWVTLRSGVSPSGNGNYPGETIDVTVARKIGGYTRFRSLIATATGNAQDALSYEDQNTHNDAENSPIAFYRRLFGPEFQDPNSGTFTPSARIMAQKSVLSGVREEANDLIKELGAEDRVRVDQYFTGLRELERQFDQQLKKPEPIASCVRPDPPRELEKGLEVELLAARHRQMTELMVMAVACDQTRVFGMVYANPFAATTKAGLDKTHHSDTHEEAIDEGLGYQPVASWFTQRAMESWRDYVAAFAKVKEGDRSLLDNVLIYAHSDQSLAKVHGIDGIPMFTAGQAGGRFRTGLHVAGAGSAGTRLGYTAMRALGLDIESWGAQSNKTSNEIADIRV